MACKTQHRIAIGMFAFFFVASAPADYPAGTELAPIEPQGSMSVDRAGHQATVLRSGLVFISGGCGGNGCESVRASVELFDPATGRFDAAGTMLTPRVSHIAALLPNGNVLLAGGWSGTAATNDSEVYDPATKQFSRVGPMSVARMTASAVTLPDGRVVITGGETAVGAAVDTVEIFDPKTKQFSHAGTMTAPRSRHTAVLLRNGHILLIGGHRARMQVLQSAEIFNPTNSSARATGPMSVPRHKHAAILLSDDRVLVIGGSNDLPSRDGRYQDSEIYDPRTGKFSPGPALDARRHKIPDAVGIFPKTNTVIVAGGAAAFGVWTPGQQAFTEIARVPPTRAEFATLTLLPDGRMMLAGGYDEGIRPTAASWILPPPR